MIDFDALAEKFAANGWRWNLKGRGSVVPTAEDIEVALDTAAEILYDEDPETNPQLSVGRLIIKKTYTGYDVYVFEGTHI